ncbi:MAG: M48 family metalloprotease [candidate division KSB1 bacterium]|nr:M48 family metalloprotease [candidate division KSB1 bacterium]MDZ7301543.1 M48 family metalloprotease [candidate division KSB1 bacterium]MDZ7311041.1 M48 family metalloprotease [candidate division KSB1 bacterium]
MSRIRLLTAFGLALMALLAWACARDYVTGKKTFTLVSESQEIAMGREADPSIVAEYGVYDDANLAAYVNSIGQSMVKVSHRPNLQFTFRLMDSPVVNAFALPGGYVYFTRGILAHFNSEAELAGVMGHEIGHVTARHGAEQMTKAQLATLGLGLGSILSEDFRRFSDIAQTGLGLLFLKFSRDNESESDLLGVEYSTKAGYDAHQMARFFSTISRITEKAGGGPPTFLSTHPNPENREQRVGALATEWQQKVPGPKGGTDRAAYLRRIDGIVYGDDPRQGFVEGGYFYHPELRFQFMVPDKWQIANQPSQVQMVNPEQNAGIQFSLGKGASPQEAAQTFANNSQAEVLRHQATQVNGMPAYLLISNLQTQSGVLRVMSYFIQMGSQIYMFHGYTSPTLFDGLAPTFERVMRSFDQLRNQAALSKQPRRVKIMTVDQAGDLKQILTRFGVKQEELEEIAILNGMNLTDRLQAGELVKVVR